MTETIDRARDLLASYHRRERVFGPWAELFCDPAWIMLLTLFVDSHDDCSHSVTALAVGSMAPLATGQRWIYALEQRGLVKRAPDARDKRRSFIEMTPLGTVLLDRFFSE